jgi:hypothetical protein
MELTNRKAHCVYCGHTASSSEKLPFFEYRGPGSHAAEEMCRRCGFAKRAHLPMTIFGNPGVVADGLCEGFEAKGDVVTDQFYCGCRGWD